MLRWLLGPKIYRTIGAMFVQSADKSKIDCRDEYYAGVSFETLAERILRDARDMTTAKSHTDDFVVLMTPGGDDHHRKLVKLIRAKAHHYDLQLVGHPGHTVKLRKVC